MSRTASTRFVQLLPVVAALSLSACGEQQTGAGSELASTLGVAGTRIGAHGTTVAAHGDDWFNEAGGGASADVSGAYALRPVPAGAPIVVAVIDSGIDIEHEDLQGRIWVNEGEVPDDGIDNDHNGYVDDVNGWNFLVDRDGHDIDGETTELAREFARYYKPYLASRNGTGPALSQADYNKLLALYNELQPLQQAAEPGSDQARFHYNWQLDQRGDDLTDFTPINGSTPDLAAHQYGNNHIIGPDALHGTHVAGIIAAVRDNGLGIDGIASNVRIMVLRAVPNGDEQDKDVANAIRYAADNGARVVNMSFGKTHSRFPEKVVEAMEYAASKGVLFVHAAGNDNKNTDTTANFPNRKVASARLVNQWLEVGASTESATATLPAEFSNFGASSVDLFAPGYEILSTTPGSTYQSLSGTSMASPVVAGIAALVLSYKPSLSAAEVKTLLTSTVHDYRSLRVYKPGTHTRVLFSTLSRSGGVVDAKSAVSRLAP